MPEGDTIHRAASRLNAAFDGREVELADAPNPRSPLHRGVGRLEGLTFRGAEAFGKHLLVSFSERLVVHTHLGMNGRLWTSADGRLPYGKPWLRLASGRAVAAQTGGKILRLTTEARVRNDPALRQLGPDPLRAEFDARAAAERLRVAGRGREVGDVLLDQRIIAGVGNAIRNEVLFRAGISPWRRTEELDEAELDEVIGETVRVMEVSVRRGRRPRSIYRADRRGCPTCGGPVSVRGQGDDNRAAYWCPTCQR